MTDLIGGQVDLHFASFPAAAELVRSGKLKALAVTTLARTAQMPEVPTLAAASGRAWSRPPAPRSTDEADGPAGRPGGDDPLAGLASA